MYAQGVNLVGTINPVGITLGELDVTSFLVDFQDTIRTFNSDGRLSQKNLYLDIGGGNLVDTTFSNGNDDELDPILAFFIGSSITTNYIIPAAN